jgi:hypothetical protein
LAAFHQIGDMMIDDLTLVAHELLGRYRDRPVV